jgi:hypothetical protein
MAERKLDELIGKLKVLKIEEASILSQIAELNSNTPRPATRTSSSEERVNGIAKGDRVRIKNRVRKPATWTSETEWTEAKERLATVTRVTLEQIHFVTDNGTRTWRAPNNVRRLVENEH